MFVHRELIDSGLAVDTERAVSKKRGGVSQQFTGSIHHADSSRMNG